MIELARTADPVRLSFLQAVLQDAGVEAVVLDGHAAALFGSALDARLMVDEADLAQARRVIAAAEAPAS
ncbi:MAG: DUF2007 domain-containing protein [Caulobacteraceae bacterium]|nr:DUF2007 domain-containing protein [Caulobacteraceae bacterium]